MNGLWVTDDLYPNLINLRVGGEDDGVLIISKGGLSEACTEYGLDVVAAMQGTKAR
jgi:serine protease AprX